MLCNNNKLAKTSATPAGAERVAELVGSIAPDTLSKLTSQIGIASLASPGEILYQTMVAGPNINGETFTDRGPISISGGATLNVSGNAPAPMRSALRALIVYGASMTTPIIPRPATARQMPRSMPARFWMGRAIALPAFQMLTKATTRN